MPVERIESIETFAVRLPRDTEAVRGTAGSPTKLASGRFGYRWSETNNSLYSVHFEAAMVKVTLSSGQEGWGEPQAPLAPEIACQIVELLLRPAVEGLPFDGLPATVKAIRDRMYATMRVRGQTGGFMLDAIAGVDIALWDLAGKMAGRPVAALLSASTPKPTVPCYLSGLSGDSNRDRVERARRAWGKGFRTFKLFHDRTEEELFDLFERLRDALGPRAEIAVDALWRLQPGTAHHFGARLDDLGCLWLECPLQPELVEEHAALARRIRTPVALGESYRSRFEMKPFLASGCASWLQPDLGRWGITEAAALASEERSGCRIVPHISIAMGPQIAAALHLSASFANIPIAEYNPAVFDVANRFLNRPVAMDGAAYRIPEGPGLGIEIDESAVRAATAEPTPLDSE